MRYHPAKLIEIKRDGGALDPDMIRDLVSGVVDGTLSDAQLGALLMAGFLRGSNERETTAWTEAMRDSGLVLDLSGIPGPKVDKHSTGGVGDKVSLVLGPLAASLGLVVPMISGRGLGFTGGTVDKLESIPGFRMELATGEFLDLLERTGLAMSAATVEIAPADRRMYAIRDVTATVPHLPWIVSSILSKKLAEGIDALVLDVKCGRGAFMREQSSAEELARALVRTAEALGCLAAARITAMDRPLGRAVGNALEVAEAVSCLRGEGPSDLRELVVQLTADMLVLGGLAPSLGEARRRAAAALDAGRGLEAFRRMVELQGGDPRVVEDPAGVLPRAPVVETLRAEAGGWLTELDALAVGWAAVELGAGRRRPGETIDPSVGIVCCKVPGEPVTAGERLLEIHASSPEAAAAAREQLAAAVVISRDRPPARPLVLGSVFGSEREPGL